MLEENNEEVQVPENVELKEGEQTEQTSVDENVSNTGLSSEVIEAALSNGQVKTFYMQKEVIERLGTLDSSGAELCKLEDGTTAYVPKAVLGE